MPAQRRVLTRELPPLLAIVARPVFAHANVPLRRDDHRVVDVVRARNYGRLMAVVPDGCETVANAG